MRINNNRSFSVHLNNNHLLNIFDEEYYIELGNIDINIINGILSGSHILLSDIIYDDLLTGGIGKMSDDDEDKKLQFSYLFYLHQKRSTDKFVITCGTCEYLNYNNVSIYAPIILLPIEIDYSTKQILLNGAPSLNRVLVDYLLRNTLNKDESFKRIVDGLFTQTSKLQTVLEIDNICRKFKELFNVDISCENYLTYMDVEYPEFTIKDDFFTTQRSIYETSDIEIETTFYKSIKPILPTNIEQKYIINKAMNKESFCVNGKLGSGKTSTILNIIATSIRNKKRVLYLNQSLNNIHDFKKQLAMLKLDKYEYDLTSCVYPVFDQETVDGVKANVEILPILKQIYDLDKIYETKHHGYPYNYIIEKIAIEKAYKRDIRIELEKTLERHETEHIYKSLLKVEEAFKDVKQFPDNPWAKLLSSKNAPKVDEIIERTKNFYATHKKVISELTKAGHKYGIEVPQDITDFNRLNEELLSFSNVKPLKTWRNKNFYNEAYDALHTIGKYTEDYDNSVGYYKETCVEDYKPGDVSKYFKIITQKYYNITDVNSPDIIYTDKILSCEHNLKQLIKDLTTFIKLYSDTYEELKQYFDLENTLQTFTTFQLFEDYFATSSPIDEWIIEYLSSPRDFIKKGEEFVELHNAITMKIDKLSIYIHLDIIDYESLRQLANNHQLPRLRKYVNKANLKKDKLNLNDLTQMIKSLVEESEVLNAEVPGIGSFNNKESAWKNYARFIKLVSSLDRVGIKMFNTLVSRMQRNKNLTYNRFNELIKYINSSEAKIKYYINIFNTYLIATSTNTPLDSIKSFEETIPQLKRIDQAKDHILSNFINANKVTTVDVLILMQVDNIYADALDHFEKEAAHYRLLFGDAYAKENTDTPLIGRTIEHYRNFTMRNIASDQLVRIVTEEPYDNPSWNEINKMSQIFVKLYNDWYNALRGFSTCFFGGMMSLQSNTFLKNLDIIKRHIDSLDEVEKVAIIESELDIYYSYGLKDLPKKIQDGIYKDGIADAFLYSMMCLYNEERISQGYPSFDLQRYESLINEYIEAENALCLNNLYYLQNAKIENHSSLKVSSSNDPYRYFTNVDAHKLLFIGDLDFLNNVNDLYMFDLVLVDDAHLSLASNYNLISKCNQAIIFGDKRFQSSISNFLLQRLPQDSFVRLHKRYAMYTSLFNNDWTLNNQFLYTSLIKTSYTKYDTFDHLITEIVKCYHDHHQPINILVASSKTMRYMYMKLFGQLVKEYSFDDTIVILNEMIRIINTPQEVYKNGESSRVTFATYVYCDDFIKTEYNLLFGLYKNYIQANSFIKMCYLDHTEEENKLLEKLIFDSVGKARERNIIIKGVTSKLFDDLTEASLKPEKGFGFIDIIIKAKTKIFGIVIYGKRNVVNFSALDNYLFYVNEYKKIGWNIFVYSMEDFEQRYDEIKDEIIKQVGNIND